VCVVCGVLCGVLCVGVHIPTSCNAQDVENELRPMVRWTGGEEEDAQSHRLTCRGGG
jgi:hypothetical protein